MPDTHLGNFANSGIAERQRKFVHSTSTGKRTHEKGRSDARGLGGIK